ncbi:MAG TPA: hypothetical protein VIK14_17660 [Ignavibacteria bacterium]
METNDKYKYDGIENWRSLLDHFVDIVNRYPINIIYNFVTKEHQFSIILEDYIYNGSEIFAGFQRELMRTLSESQNPEIILQKVKSEFLPLISKYKEWFELHGKGTEIFGNYNPYKLMNEYFIKTETEIKKYLPKKNQPEKKLKTFERLFIQEEYAVTVIKIFTEEEYLISGKWAYPGNSKSIATPFYILQDYFRIIKNDTTPQRSKLRIWCNKLGVYPNDDNLKNLLLNPAKGKNPTPKFRQEQKEFYKLFESSFSSFRLLE